MLATTSSVTAKPAKQKLSAPNLLSWVDSRRVEAYAAIPATVRAEFGQYGTPSEIAKFMASMFVSRSPSVRLLDAGAGVGSLTAAAIVELLARPSSLSSVKVAAWEIDEGLRACLAGTLQLCGALCEAAGVRLDASIHGTDFLLDAVRLLDTDRPAAETRFTHAILNPPYKKINGGGLHRQVLKTVGIETTNLYTAFLALAVKLLVPGGELVAITPRSFCNGTYFRSFRKFLLEEMTLKRVHVFGARDRAFADDGVLQENVILHAVKEKSNHPIVCISASPAPGETGTSRMVPLQEVIRPDDSESFIRFVLDARGKRVAGQMAAMHTSLQELGLSVSTGKVVEFRAKSLLESRPIGGAVPLIYPCHLRGGEVRWPATETKRPNAIRACAASSKLLIRNDVYVLVKRFSPKEEPRRVVAAVHDPASVPGEVIAFENHLNYFHQRGDGLPLDLARGLAMYLNSSLLDEYFRQFSGHTQVNATDLRNIRYPSMGQLIALGQEANLVTLSQSELDKLVERSLDAHARKTCQDSQT